MNPNQTHNSVKLDDLVSATFDYESTLRPKFAWWPTKIDGQWVWLDYYFVQYRARNPFTPYQDSLNKEIFDRHTAEDIVSESLKGNVVNGKLLTTPRRRFTERK